MFLKYVVAAALLSGSAARAGTAVDAVWDPSTLQLVGVALNFARLRVFPFVQ